MEAASQLSHVYRKNCCKGLLVSAKHTPTHTHTDQTVLSWAKKLKIRSLKMKMILLTLITVICLKTSTDFCHFVFITELKLSAKPYRDLYSYKSAFPPMILSTDGMMKQC